MCSEDASCWPNVTRSDKSGKCADGMAAESVAAAASDSTSPLAPRYLRNCAALSARECAALRSKRVFVAGCGGLGGHVIDMLARMGVGALEVCDNDAFDATNLNRQLLATEAALGQHKAAAAAAHVSRVNSEVRVIAHDTPLHEGNAAELVNESDCVVDALDNPKSRFTLAYAALEAGIPVVYGAVAGWYGQVCTVFPGDASFVGIYGTEKGEGVQKTEGVLPMTAASVAAMQAAEVVKVLLKRDGIIRNRLLMMDLLSSSCDSMEFAP